MYFQSFFYSMYDSKPIYPSTGDIIQQGLAIPRHDFLGTNWVWSPDEHEPHGHQLRQHQDVWYRH